MTAPRRLFCWSGGGLPGIDIHVGICTALDDAEIYAAAHAGTSAGALMAAFLATDRWDGDELEDLVADLRDQDVRDERAAWRLRLPWIDHWLKDEPIRRLLRQHLPPDFSALPIPCSIHATRNDTGEGVALTTGSLTDAVMASMAISGVLPSVRIGGVELSDGGTTANIPLPADYREYDEIWLLVASRPLEYRRRGDSVLSRLIYSADLLMEAQMRETIRAAQASGRVVRVIRPPVRCFGGALRFDHRLIYQARAMTREMLIREGIS